MQALKSIGSILLGIAIFVGIVVVTILLFTLGAKVAFTIQPFINWLAGIVFAINLIALLIAIIPSARGVSGVIIYLSSYVYGLGTWIFGLAVTLALWGWVAVIVGILIGGIGVVPVGLLAAIFHGRWDIFWTLLINLLLTYGARIIGMVLVSSAERRSQDNENEIASGVIDLEPEIPERTWKDVE